MEQNRYHEAMEQIKTPFELKERTRYKLQAQIRKHKIIRISWGMSALAAVLAIVIGLNLWQGASGNFIMTELVAGQHSETVLLQDGELHFIALTEEDIRAPIRLAPPYPIRQNWGLEEYSGVLPLDPPEGLAMPEGGVTAYFAQPADQPDAIIGQATYQAQKGGLLTIVFTNNSALLPLPITSEDSEIAGISVGVGFWEAEQRYVGVYQKGDYTFILTTEGMEQEEFIRLLYDFIS